MNQTKGSPNGDKDDVKHESLTSSDKHRLTDQIGRQLRGMYDGLLNQPVPDRFMDLMKRLETSDRDLERES